MYSPCIVEAYVIIDTWTCHIIHMPAVVQRYRLSKVCVQHSVAVTEQVSVYQFSNANGAETLRHPVICIHTNTQWTQEHHRHRKCNHVPAMT